MSGQAGEVTLLLRRMRAGDSAAAAELIPQVFDELRRLARNYLKAERTGHTLQPTALVNEAYLRLVPDQPEWESRAHFIGVTASVMRRVLIDYARRRHRVKRGSDPLIVQLEECDTLLSEQQSEELLALNHALDRLDEMNPRHRQIVEMRYFGGLSVDETAEALGVSAITVKRDWLAARSWLRTQICPETLDSI